MPYRRKYRKKRKKKTYRRRRRRLTSMSVPSGMSTQKVAKLRYVATTNITSTAGILNSQVFRANSIFDPDFTGIGTQPMGHDQWEVLFNRYKVLGARISLNIIPSTANTTNGMVGVYLTDSATSPYNNPRGFIEARKGMYRNVLSKNNKTAPMHQNFSAKRFFNVTDVKDNQNIGADFGTNPPQEAYFNIWYDDIEAGTSTVLIVSTIEYIVSFSEPKDLVQS